MDEMVEYGKRLVSAHLAHSHFGNISKRMGDKMLITATGSMLDRLEDEIIEVPLRGESTLDVLASTEVRLHRAVYEKTSALAIIHTHSPYAVAMSLIEKEALIPADSESRLTLHRIPIVEGDVGGDELANATASLLKSHKAVIIRGHGPVCRGNTLDEAFVYACCVEHSAHIAYLLLRKP